LLAFLVAEEMDVEKGLICVVLLRQKELKPCKLCR